MGIKDEIFYGLLLALAGFLFSMVLTPFYTHFAYKYKFWKKQKKTTVDGKDLPVMTKLHAHKFKHVFPTMAGLIGVVAVTAVTWIFNFDRCQTWLPLAGFLGGALVGVIDDMINIFGSGRGAAGLRGPVKFALITIVGLTLGWFFAYKLGWTTMLIPFVGNIEIGALAVTLIFAFAVVATSNAVNISDGLDGLSGGLSMIAYGAFGIIALFQGNMFLFDGSWLAIFIRMVQRPSGSVYDGRHWLVRTRCGSWCCRYDDQFFLTPANYWSTFRY